MAQNIPTRDGHLLLELARLSIENKLKKNTARLTRLEEELPPYLSEEKRGTFVSLHKRKELRGCIGNIEPVKSIAAGIKDNAGHAAFDDSRFNPLTLDELEDTDIEVSILTSPQRLEYTDYHELLSKLEPGKDGVIIKKGFRSATFLPQVWEQLCSPESFLNHLCLKAGLKRDEWKHGALEVSVYRVQSFDEKDMID